VIDRLIGLFVVIYLKQLQAFIEKIEYGEVATVVGRYYAMDRDKRWERIKVAFDGLYKGVGEAVQNSQELFDVGISASVDFAVCELCQ
jgi:bisphosphoglycerate-independent phosphoglycerate mutase (AlkP superfamily)